MVPRLLSRPLALLSLVAALAAGSCTRRNAPDGPLSWVLAPEDSHFGMTYAEWSARWWQWTYELPRTSHPGFDQTGAEAWRGQVDPVWFLSGPWSDGLTPSTGTVVRTIDLPAGTAVFFPIINTGWDNQNCLPPDWVEHSFTELRQGAYDTVSSVTDVHLEIDGVPIIDAPDFASAFRWRAMAPEFSCFVPDDNMLAGLCGVSPLAHPVGPIASDGLWAMIGPMPPGGHTLHFSASFNQPVFFHLDTTYHINVLP